MNKRLNANEEFKAKKADINRLLLHVCCAPCLASALAKLKNIDVTCFYYNPNIMPKLEWQRRLTAVKTLIDAINAGKFGKEYRKFDLVVVDNGSSAFFDAIKGDELLGEHTQRCTKCIGFRLKKTAEWAQKNGFNYFATTLTSSAQKNSELINSIGTLCGGEGYVATDFKKDNGALESKEICARLGLYRQNYCGCGLPEKEQPTKNFLDILNTPFKIGKLKIKNRLLLAPMAGWTDVGFRRVAAECGAGYTTTEMVSAKALVFESKKTLELLATTESEKIKAVQLFGSDAGVISKAANLKELQKFDIIDLNMGCPMPKIVKNGDGSALMDNLNKASEIISTLRASTNKPITVKFRKGGKTENAIEFAAMCEKSGADALIVHGRTRQQMYAGENDFEVIKQIASSVKIPVIVSGDILTREEAAWALHYTGAAAVMIGRGAVGNPGIFGKQISNKDAIKMQLETDSIFLGEKKAAIECKKHIANYFRGTSGATKIKMAVLLAKTTEEILSLVENYTENI